MPIIRRLGHTDVNARIEAKVFADLICEPGIHGADPIGVPLRAHAAEEFGKAGQFPDNCVANADGVGKFSVITISYLVSVKAERALKTHLPIRHVEGVGNSQTAFHGIVAEVILASWQFYEGNERESEKTAVIASEIHFEAWRNVAKAGLSFDSARAFVLGAFQLIGHQHKLKIHIVEHAEP